ncbi:MAG: molybdate ABC transporter substrate-binding protein [Saprospiraceae bacterium]|nr:molybdate ABC transporter substrate-binding protein [Saprospiraceae bacterium]
MKIEIALMELLIRVFATVGKSMILSLQCRRLNYSLGLLYCVILVSCVPQKHSFTIAAAANTHYVMRELIDRYEEQGGVKAHLVVGSSGQLTAQIIQGAPYDLFFSADMRYPQVLSSNELTEGELTTYAKGYLVLWSMVVDSISEIKSLAGPLIEQIAIANPQTAPYGRAAQQALQYFNLLPDLEHKLVFGESISQTNQFILSEAADVGFTAKSVILSKGIQGKGYWMEVPTESYAAIEQAFVVLKTGHQPQASIDFVKFLRSDLGTSILRKYGYDTYTNDADRPIDNL